MTVSVVVPTWRRPADLGPCLEGLAAQHTLPAEVLVVGRSDDQDTRAVLERGVPSRVPVRAVWVDRSGVVASLNAGLSAATGDVVAITDDDAVPRPEWLDRMTGHFERAPDVGAVGGRDHVQAGGSGQRTVGRVRWYGRTVGNHHLGVGGAREVDVLKGVSMGFRRAALRGIRAEESLRGANMQLHWEVGLCLAVKRAGWKLVYDPAVSVDHYSAPRLEGDARLQPSPATLSDEVYNQTYCLARWLPWWRALPAVGYGFVVGTRRAPGPVTAIESAARGRLRRGALRMTTRARWEAVRAAARARPEGRA